ncbi:hypothetical protein [Streptomyces montanisoli]|uniref:Uncharacterized protein n=1 Tax=Streptomyces montanisoli TaxID=2798581 RepID=A0A940M9V7_9ACTN|nr:hypothetical protein [Streptomyces montanisoli]MBP0458970.1 hypothetical protein [Streptomyces montanisoli]
MLLADTCPTLQRMWTVELRHHPGGLSLACSRCASGRPLRATSARSAALTHLASHARTDVLPGHLRTCQCRARGCHWHTRHRGCSGPVLLALTCERSGRSWRLADACAACVAATSHTAVVPSTLPSPTPRTVLGAPAAGCASSPYGPAEQRRVREMLTYLAAALPCFTSPAARLLALQCALRADTRGQVRLPGGFLRSMRLHGRMELWHELEHAGWLHRVSRKADPLTVRLLDATVLAQAPGRAARTRAAEWALRPAPLEAAGGLPPVLRLTALALAAHTTAATGDAEIGPLSRLCGQPPQQLPDLLDHLVRSHLLALWRRSPDHEGIIWLVQGLTSACG